MPPPQDDPRPEPGADDPFGLQRFVAAQASTLQAALQELSLGHKRSHWMWFVFPQLRVLGRSETARRYGLASAEEALAYWQHPLLGPRLRQCVERLLGVDGRSALQVFGTVDALKFCSSMTLFEQVAPQEPVFGMALQKYCAGRRDDLTLDWLQSQRGSDASSTKAAALPRAAKP
jgi:uncharacterized protein (DUF1810 family)